MRSDFGDPEAVKNAIEIIQSRLSVSPNPQLQAEAEAGFHPNLLAHKGAPPGGKAIPVIEKYLIGATSYLRQPINYYDIFGAARCVLMTQLLGEALEIISAAKIQFAEDRLKRLVPILDPDSYDSTLFELVSGTRYALEPLVDRVEFIPETNAKTPDFLVTRGSLQSLVECKKVARVRQVNTATRNLVRDRLNSVVSHFRQREVSALFEIDFTSDPTVASENELLHACRAALEEKIPIVTAGFTVSAKLLAPFKHDGPILYPSPRFSWLRYRYRIRSEWFGLVHQIEAQTASLSTLPESLKGGLSTWILSVYWDAAIKWKITSKEVVAKYRRFAFDGIFDAIKQINNCGQDSTVHLWVETEYFLGRRQEVMLDLFKRLNQNPDQSVGWIVLNETLLDVSPRGLFDLIEHAHLIRGPTALGEDPIISGVFGKADQSDPYAEFGVGSELPDIDEC